MKKMFIAMSVLFSLTITSVNAVEVTVEEKITGLYVGYFNRAADQKGLDYWTAKAEEVAQQGGNVSSVFIILSGGFATHPTFKTTYDHLNNKAFIEAIYRNALGRDGDAQGITYWTDLIDRGMSRSDMVATFVELSMVTDLTKENYPSLSTAELAAAQLRQDLITNKVTVALTFTKQLGTLSNVVDNNDPENDPAYIASIMIISGVTEAEATVLNASGFLEGIVGSTDPVGQINASDSLRGNSLDEGVLEESDSGGNSSGQQGNGNPGSDSSGGNTVDQGSVDGSDDSDHQDVGDSLDEGVLEESDSGGNSSGQQGNGNPGSDSSGGNTVDQESTDGSSDSDHQSVEDSVGEEVLEESDSGGNSSGQQASENPGSDSSGGNTVDQGSVDGSDDSDHQDVGDSLDEGVLEESDSGGNSSGQQGRENSGSDSSGEGSSDNNPAASNNETYIDNHGDIVPVLSEKPDVLDIDNVDYLKITITRNINLNSDFAKSELSSYSDPTKMVVYDYINVAVDIDVKCEDYGFDQSDLDFSRTFQNGIKFKHYIKTHSSCDEGDYESTPSYVNFAGKYTIIQSDIIRY